MQCNVMQICYDDGDGDNDEEGKEDDDKDDDFDEYDNVA